LAAIVTAIVPGPVPAAPDCIVTQAVSVRADHAQLAPVETAIDAVPPSKPKVLDVTVS
jgi:hypothetical protein